MELRKSKVPVAAAPPVNLKEEKKASYDQGLADGKTATLKEISKKVTEIRKSNTKLQEIISDASKQVAHNGAVLIELKTGDFEVPPSYQILPMNGIKPDRKGEITYHDLAITGRFSSKEPPMSEPLREGETLPPGEKSILTVMAQFHGASTEQLTVMTGYKRSSRNTYIQRMRAKNLFTEEGGGITASSNLFD
jgi:hypothetical protein